MRSQFFYSSQTRMASLTRELNIFRSVVEGNDEIEFERLIWSSPSYLVGPGDTPQILKPAPRYNALHCAIRSGSTEVAKKLLDILESENFWKLLYPSDSTEIRIKRKSFTTDLFLNMCDKVVHETPLHMAAKYGQEQMVVLLITNGANPEALNKYRERPSDIVCSRVLSSEATKERIRKLLAGPTYFVPVIRTLDNTIAPRLSSPCTLVELERECSGHKLDGPVISSAIAGPMSDEEAATFYREWRTPTNRSEATNIKRSDPDRGFERIGRQLAHHRRVGWREHWGFLNRFCDLSQPEGLRLLEKYITTAGRENSFLAGSKPTKLDLDVSRAVGQNVWEFPEIQKWKRKVDSYPEEEKRGWRTPSRKHCFRNHTQETALIHERRRLDFM